MTSNAVRIVVLDGFALNPGDLGWEPLQALGECMIHDRTPADKIVERARDAEVVMTNKNSFSGDVLSQLPKLQYIGVMATGYDDIDLETCRRRRIVVTNVPSYSTHSVAQMVFAHLLNLTTHVADHAIAVRQGRWSKAPDWCFWDTPLLELQGMTLGIVGFGRIGRATAQLGLAFGMKVLATGRPGGRVASHEGVRGTDLEELLRSSDVVSLHCPLTGETEGLLDRTRLSLMKPTALLINTSRGQLIDEDALAEALNAGRLGGAGLDVLSSEPPDEDNPLVHAKNCYITPHIGWATQAARQRLMDTLVDNLAAYLRGEPKNVVSM